MILLHGFLSSSFSFRKLIPFLNKEFRVIAIDIPPFGKSGKSRNFRYTYENMAKTVLALLDALHCKNIYAAGHSMGGQIVLNMMHIRPCLIQKGILLCSSGYLARARTPLIMSTYIPLFSRYVKYYLGKTGVLGNLKTVVYDQSLIDEAMVNGYTEPFNQSAIFPALAMMLRHREGDLSEDILRTIETECLLLWGEHDRVVPVQTGKRLAADLPNSKLVIFKEAGHLIPEEVPEHVYREMRDFIFTHE